jgi:hypothetical protein
MLSSKHEYHTYERFWLPPPDDRGKEYLFARIYTFSEERWVVEINSSYLQCRLDGADVRFGRNYSGTARLQVQTLYDEQRQARVNNLCQVR